MTNFFLTVIVTNWVRLSGDIQITDGTNRMIREQMVVNKTNFVCELRICTNLNPYKVEHHTNDVKRWVPENLQPPLPGTPGRL